MKRNLQIQAKRYDEDILVHRSLLVWRVQLRVKLKMSKHAKAARKYLLLKSSWNKWKEVVDQRKREEKLRSMELQIVMRKFESEPPFTNRMGEVIDRFLSCRMAHQGDSYAEP